jgi:hypothetical protein
LPAILIIVRFPSANKASKNRLRKGKFVSPIPSNLARPRSLNSHQAHFKQSTYSKTNLPSDKNTDSENIQTAYQVVDLPSEGIQRVFLDSSLVSFKQSPELSTGNQLSMEPSTSNFTETLGITTMPASIPPPVFDPLKSLVKNNKVIPMEEIRNSEEVD